MSTTDIAPVSRCTRCGSNLEPGARFCSNCGQAVDAEPAKPEPTYWSDSSSEWRTPAASTMPPLSAAFDSGGGIGKLFSGSGRISRLEYFLIIVGIWVALAILWAISAVFEAPTLLLLLTLVVWLVSTVIAICAGVKRLHDFDQSGWLYLLFLIPFAGFFLFFALLLKGSSPGLNQYGYADSGSVMG